MMQDVVVQVPPPPAPPEIPAPPTSQAPTPLPGDPGSGIATVAPTPRAILQAKEQQREVLGDQMSRLLNRRQDVASQLQSPELGPAEKTALQDHYVALNGSIIQMEKAIQQ